ncbi:efflux RND transporter periplasmic adaptor subunit [Zoogloea sp.]|uniref:efflux RND transporter periplasmic adaptor subunit n=1 Tax=Zoogloea sp. TaxID=49181 RepID=UPI0035B0715B
MKTPAALALAAALALGGTAGGYWFGTRSATPPTAAADARPTRKLLYYRNPMGLPDTSPTPKKDPMGMDYIPVYEGEDATGDPAPAGQVKIAAERIQTLGVRTEQVALRPLERRIRAAGRVEPDEQRLYTVAPKFEGYVERLHVNVTGQPVARGQVLFEAYSPELLSAQREYQIAAQGVEALRHAGSEARDGMQQLADSALARLRNWDIPDARLRALARNGSASRTLPFTSPVAGIVTEKKAVQGARFMPGEALYRVADLSRVWVMAELFEQDIAAARVGAPVTVRVDAYPDKTFDGRVAYLYPSVNPDTRTAPVRVELANPGLLLKPGMFARIEIGTGGSQPVLSVPTSAVIDSGTRQVVLLAQGEGRFTPRAVKLGQRDDVRVAVLDGLTAGDTVVVAANFLIDAESNLKAALAGFGPPQPAAGGKGHTAEGVVDSLDLSADTAMLTHGPVPSLNWPAMTMEFKLASPSLRAGLKPGAKIAFDFVEQAPGEWTVTAIRPAAATPPAHTGH